MAVPRRRTSKTRKNKRRANHMKLKKTDLANCPQCKQPKLPHRVCIHCGFYKGREVIKMSQ